MNSLKRKISNSVLEIHSRILSNKRGERKYVLNFKGTVIQIKGQGLSKHLQLEKCLNFWS